MISSKLDLSLPLRYIRYGRMSDEEQNPRSPEQQFDDINRTKKKQGRDNWVHVKDYRDDAISGRYKRKRPGWRDMMDAIRCGLLKIDAILVDTIERFARLQDLDTIREELRKKYGVVILTSDTGFTDPTSMVGRIYGAMEAVRASSAAAQKAHDVLRGKIDVVMMKRWAGGDPPCGYKLEARTETITRANGKTVENVYHVLVPDPTTREIPERVYQLAYEKGWGRTRVTKALNADKAFVRRHGKVSESLVGHVMNSTTYKGTYRFNFLASDIDDDCRITQRKDPDEVLYIENFCEPIVESNVVDKVHADVRARSQKILDLRASKKGHDGKQLQPVSCGLVLVYPLTGLVRCSKCGAAMRPSRSGAKSEKAECYYYYRCPCANDDRCENKIYLRGPWLWEAVIARVREVLFPLGPNDGGNVPDWLGSLITDVRTDLAHRLEQQQDRRPSLEQELKDIDGKVAGWTETLSKTDLSSLVRAQVEQQLGNALERKQAIGSELEVLSATADHLDVVLDPKAAIDRLVRLHEVLANGSASDMNVELALHIESILVHPEGRVAMRTNRLGIFEGAAQIVAGKDDECVAPGDEKNEADFQIRPRALSRRRTTTPAETSPLAKADGVIEGHVALPDKWVDESIFQMPKLSSWAEENSEKVFRRRQEAKLSYAKLGEEFGVTAPTARAAVKQYLANHPDAVDQVRLRPGGKRPKKFDLSEFAVEARQLWEAGWSKLKLAEKYGCSTPTIDKAIAFAYGLDGLPMPKSRDRRQVDVVKARALFDAGRRLDEIAAGLKLSDVTVRQYLRESFAAEGKTMPDLRRRHRA